MTRLEGFRVPGPPDDGGTPGPRGNGLPILPTAVWFGLIAGLLELALLAIRVQILEKGFFLRSRHFLWMVPVSVLVIFASWGLLLAAGRPSGSAALAAPGDRELPVSGFPEPVPDRPGAERAHVCAAVRGDRVPGAEQWLDGRRAGLRRLIRFSSPLLAAALVLLTTVATARDPSLWRRARAVVPDGATGPQRPADRPGYGPGRSPRPVRVRSRHDAEPGPARGAGRPVPPRPVDGAVDAPFARQPVHRPIGRTSCGPNSSAGSTRTYPTLAEVMRARGYSTGGFVANTVLLRPRVRPVARLRDVPGSSGQCRRDPPRIEPRLVPVAEPEPGSRGAPVGDHRRRPRPDRTRLPSQVGLDRQSRVPRLARPGWRTSLLRLPELFRRPRSLHPARAAAPTVRRRPDVRASNSRCSATGRSSTGIRSTRPRCRWPATPTTIASPRSTASWGALFDELHRRGILDRTLVILTADHGEQFGEHGSFGHGMSLYEPEVHVPLIVVFPGRAPRGATVDEPVSLRDVPATVVELLGGATPSPFPGTPLTGTWDGSRRRTPQHRGRPSPSWSRRSNRPGRAADPARPGAILIGRTAYHRHGDGTEELFDLDDDPAESRDLSGSEGAGRPCSPDAARSSAGSAATPARRPDRPRPSRRLWRGA